MSSASTPALSSALFRRPSLPIAGVLLAFAAVLPFAVHLVPWSGPRPLGAHLLPAFWTTFVAAYFFGARTAALVGLCSPGLNLIVTGLPVAGHLLGLSAELLVFALVAAQLVQRWPRGWLAAPLAFAAAHSVVLAAQLDRPFLAAALATLRTALPGIVVLLLLNLALVRFSPKTR